MGSVNVTQALNQCNSIRVFLNRPVAAPMVSEILELATQSQSTGNLQPYKVYAVSGEVKNRLCDLIAQRCLATKGAEKSDIRAFPTKLIEPWRSRRKNCEETISSALNTFSENKFDTEEQTVNNFTFFGAPVGLIVTMDRSLGESQIMDVGAYLQSVFLLACERGLATCAQVSWALWPDTVREVLAIDKREMVMAGVCLGYAKADEPVNGISHPRLRAEQFVSMHGF